MAAGYVYILTNKGYADNLLKIGMTTRTPGERAREMFEGATGVPYPFKVAFSHQVSDCELAEKLIHLKLQQHRAVQFREFFVIDLDVAVAALKEVCAEIDLAVPSKPKRIIAPTIDDKPFVYAPPARIKRKTTSTEWIGGILSVIFLLGVISSCSKMFR